MAYNEQKLDELACFISRGITPSYTEADGMYVINQKCIRNGKLSLKEARLHNGSKKKVPAEKILRQMDILVNSTGVGTLGRVAQVTEDIGNATVDSHVTIVRPIKSVDPLFLGYAVKWRQPYIEALAEGSTGQTELSRVKLGSEIAIPVPLLEVQQKIGAFLAAIDAKIAVNEKINDNLQQQLFSLYENIAMTSPCLKEYTLSNLCDFQEGYVNPAQTHPEFFDGEVKWLRAVDINESFIIETSRTLTRVGFESAKKSALLFKPKTIAISKSGTIGRLGIIADHMCGNRAVINIAPRDTNMLAFIYCFLKSKQREFPDMAVGSVQKNLYVSLLEPLTVSIPDDATLTTFNAVGASILDTIHNNCLEIAKLTVLRDTLLPKLMSGEIVVSDIQL